MQAPSAAKHLRMDGLGSHARAVKPSGTRTFIKGMEHGVMESPEPRHDAPADELFRTVDPEERDHISTSALEQMILRSSGSYSAHIAGRG